MSGTGGAASANPDSDGGGASEVGGAGAGLVSEGGSAGMGGSSSAGNGGTGGSDSQPTGDNLISDPSFEAEANAWSAWNNHTVERIEQGPRTGGWCLVSRERTEAWMGPALNVLPILTQGATYEISAWVRVSSPTSAASFTMKTLCREASDNITPSRFDPIQGFVVSDVWAEVTAAFVAPSCEAPLELQDLKLIIEGPAPGVDIYIDDVRLAPL